MNDDGTKPIEFTMKNLGKAIIALFLSITLINVYTGNQTGMIVAGIGLAIGIIIYVANMNFWKEL